MAEPGSTRSLGLVVGLGMAQTLAWASSYYLVAFMAGPQARDLGVSVNTVFAAFTAALLVAAMLGPRVGRTIDLIGGREVLAVSSLLFAAGLIVLAYAYSAPVLWAGWLLMGAGMGLGLYDAAFATLGRIYGHAARASITGITLIAGFASTVGWPLTAWGIETIGWRETCLAWAGAHILLGLPLNLLVLPRMRSATAAAESPAAPPAVRMDRDMWLLAYAFAAGWVVAAALAAHLPRLLEISGATTSQVLLAGMLLGPAQVVARLFEAALMSRQHPLVTARGSMLTHPVGAGLLLAGGGSMAAPFVLLHGGGHGILTLARGTVPLAVFGPRDYGYRLGLIGAPTRIGQAFAPLLFGFVIDLLGVGALVVTSLICISASLALFAVDIRERKPDQGADG
jgi:predicted MFS family arabinose efflux permease